MKHFFFTTLFLAVALVSSAVSPFPQGFENVTEPKGEYFNVNPNFAAVTLADNPLKAGINTSNKVAAVTMVSTSSGIIKIDFAGTATPNFDYPAHPQGLDELYYDYLRFKYYSPNRLNKNVEFEPNGSPTNPKTIVQPGPFYNEEWAYVTIPLTYKTYNNFQIRVNRNEAGNGAAAGTVDGDFVYIDDFEVYNSIAGPITSTRQLDVERMFTVSAFGDGYFSVNAFLAAKSPVRIDLISLDGRATTVFNSSAEGSVQVPFATPAQGIYLVRMTVDGLTAYTEKIISR